jgi:hypothetical protein
MKQMAAAPLKIARLRHDVGFNILDNQLPDHERVSSVFLILFIALHLSQPTESLSFALTNNFI